MAPPDVSAKCLSVFAVLAFLFWFVCCLLVLYCIVFMAYAIRKSCQMSLVNCRMYPIDTLMEIDLICLFMFMSSTVDHDDDGDNDA